MPISGQQIYKVLNSPIHGLTVPFSAAQDSTMQICLEPASAMSRRQVPDFVERILFQADLTAAKMGNAYLGNANLSYAKIEGTDLSAATLTGADLSSSRPWEAKLYGDSHSMAGPNTQAGYRNASLALRN